MKQTKYINIYDAKTNLSHYARELKKGQRYILCDRNKPFAEISPLSKSIKIKKRPIGMFDGEVKTGDHFNDPAINNDISKLFNSSI